LEENEEPEVTEEPVEPEERKYGKWFAVGAGFMLFVPSLLVTLIGIYHMTMGSSNVMDLGFYLFIFGSWTVIPGIAGLIASVCAVKQTQGYLAFIGTIFMMFVMPILAVPAFLLLYLARDEFF
jgi:hypothetical protein